MVALDPLVTLGLLSLLPAGLLLVVWSVKNRKRIPDLLRLRFKRKVVVKVNFLTRTGRNDERFIVPNHEGVMSINGGKYLFAREFAIINARWRIPEVTVLENQIHPPNNGIGRTALVETEVEVPNKDGTVTLKKVEVPSYVLSYRNQASQKLNGLWAHQMGEFADSGIVHDITVSTARVLKLLEWTFYLAIGSVVLTLLVGLILYNKMSDISHSIDAVTSALLGGI